MINPSDGTRIDGLTIRLYNPQTHDWSIYYASSANSAFGTPQKGKFLNGRGEFLERDVVGGGTWWFDGYGPIWTQTLPDSSRLFNGRRQDLGN